jgi:transcriptional regulator GlxA family with amidase domain
MEFIGRLPKRYTIGYYSANGGIIEGAQGVKADSLPLSELPGGGVLLVPGGMGTRALVNDAPFLRELKSLAGRAEYVLSVCTGAALLAAAGLLDGKAATTNRMAWGFVTAHGERVAWNKSARWVRDGNVYTAAGVSAGIDMTLGFAADLHGIETARDIARYIEYVWDESGRDDVFAV